MESLGCLGFMGGYFQNLFFFCLKILIFITIFWILIHGFQKHCSKIDYFKCSLSQLFKVPSYYPCIQPKPLKASWEGKDTFHRNSKGSAPKITTAVTFSVSNLRKSPNADLMCSFTSARHPSQRNNWHSYTYLDLSLRLCRKQVTTPCRNINFMLSKIIIIPSDASFLTEYFLWNHTVKGEIKSKR